jgi:hypothetical protein
VNVIHAVAPTPRTLDVLAGPWYAFIAREAPGTGEPGGSNAAGYEPGAPPTLAKSFDTGDAPSVTPGQLLDILGNSGLLNLNAPLRSLIQPDGVGSLDVTATDRPACFITPHYVYIHNPDL